MDAKNLLRLRRSIATHVLQGMLASAPVVDRLQVDDDVWARRALKFADALIRQSVSPAPGLLTEFLQFWGSLEITHDRKSQTYTVRYGKQEATANKPGEAVAELHDKLMNGATRALHKKANRRK